jgi:NAD(P)-dependent dehydrogenase (short-subunit alcohol dehydrogenase family)
MSNRLSGKNAVVTGAQSGNGRAIAELFASEGANVTIADIREEPREGGVPTRQVIEEADGGDAQFVKTDVTDPTDIENALDQTIEKWGSLDIMVNNAGVWPGAQPIEDVDIEEFHRVMNINTLGVFFGCKLAIETMRADGGGTIVNTSSLSGLYGFEDSALYCASKGGVSNLTRAAALEVAAEDIRVNAVNPGVIETAMAREGGVDDNVIENIPMQEWGKPEDVADGVLFLASDEARHITGVNLPIDGGLAANGYW